MKHWHAVLLLLFSKVVAFHDTCHKNAHISVFRREVTILRMHVLIKLTRHFYTLWLAVYYRYTADVIFMLTFCRSAPFIIAWFNTLRLRQNGRHFPDDNCKRIFLNANRWISTKISPKFVPDGPINNIPAFFQIMAWRRPGDKPLSESMLISLLTHICVTWPEWVIIWFNSLGPWCCIHVTVNRTIIASGNGLSRARRQTTVWVNDDVILIRS